MPRARDERFGTRRTEQKPKVSTISGAAKTRPGKPIFILSKERLISAYDYLNYSNADDV